MGSCPALDLKDAATLRVVAKEVLKDMFLAAKALA